jgi:carboxylesterase type B
MGDWKDSFVNAYVFGKGSVTAFADDLPPGINESSPFPALDPRASEECLFIDVIVPINVCNEAFQNTSGAPVVVWIYRGGSFTGSKESQGNPAGLVANLN